MAALSYQVIDTIYCQLRRGDRQVQKTAGFFGRRNLNCLPKAPRQNAFNRAGRDGDRWPMETATRLAQLQCSGPMFRGRVGRKIHSAYSVHSLLQHAPESRIFRHSHVGNLSSRRIAAANQASEIGGPNRLSRSVAKTWKSVAVKTGMKAGWRRQTLDLRNRQAGRQCGPLASIRAPRPGREERHDNACADADAAAATCDVLHVKTVSE